MAVEEHVLYFLVAPAAAYVAGTLWLRRAMRRIAEKETGFLREPGIRSRFLVHVAVFLVPTVFGLVLFIQLPQASTDPAGDAVLRALGWTWATASVLTVLSEAWILVRRGAAAYREGFARVLVVVDVAQVPILFLLIAAIQVIGALPAVGSSVTAAAATSLIRASRFMLVGSLSALLVASLANSVESLDGPGFRRAVLRATAGLAPVLVLLVLSLGEIATV